LRIGVHKDLYLIKKDLFLSNRLIHAGLKRYCRQRSYLQSILDYWCRYDIKGQPIFEDIITDFQKKVAQEQLNGGQNG
jgi:sRNA-binding protein